MTENEISPRTNLKQITTGNATMERLLGNLFNFSGWDMTMNYLKEVPKFCNEFLSDTKVQEALKQKFDLMLLSLYFSDCFISVAQKQNVSLFRKQNFKYSNVPFDYRFRTSI